MKITNDVISVEEGTGCWRVVLWSAHGQEFQLFQETSLALANAKVDLLTAFLESWNT
jgi:hypothetical protein